MTKHPLVFPIKDDRYLAGVPWAWIRKYGKEAQARHSGWTLSALADSGGLTVREVLALVYVDEPEWVPTDPTRARRMLMVMAL
jgi:hypothetical protein